MPQITAYPSAAAFLPGAASSQMVPLIHPADQALLAAAAAAANGQVNGQTGSGASLSKGAASKTSGLRITGVAERLGPTVIEARSFDFFESIAAADSRLSIIGSAAE